jgi:hypothetical protein
MVFVFYLTYREQETIRILYELDVFHGKSSRETAYRMNWFGTVLHVLHDVYGVYAERTVVDVCHSMSQQS